MWLLWWEVTLFICRSHQKQHLILFVSFEFLFNFFLLLLRSFFTSFHFGVWPFVLLRLSLLFHQFRLIDWLLFASRRQQNKKIKKKHAENKKINNFENPLFKRVFIYVSLHVKQSTSSHRFTVTENRKKAIDRAPLFRRRRCPNRRRLLLTHFFFGILSILILMTFDECNELNIYYDRVFYTIIPFPFI